MRSQWSKSSALFGGTFVTFFILARVAGADTCTGKPDGTTCDAGTDSAHTLTCSGEVCGPCTSSSATPQFVDNGDGTITDRQTCLVWEKKDNAGGIHDFNAVYPWSATGSAPDGGAFTVFIAGLNSAAFAGHRDWRLPTSANSGQAPEVESTVDTNVPDCGSGAPCVPPAFDTNCGPYVGDSPPYTGSNPGCTVDGAMGTSECSCTPPYHAWSSSSDSNTTAWIECYNVGSVSAASKTDLYNVRAVRGGLQAAPNCPATPAVNCSAAATNMVLFAGTKTPRLQWRWSEGASAMMQSDFGNPLTTTAYTLCLYDEAGGSAVFKTGATIPAAGTCGTKPCWRAQSTTGWTYRDPAARNDGIKTVTLKGGIAGKPLIKITGAGANLLQPSAFSGSEFFDEDPAVIVQLLRSDEETCWSSTFNVSGTKRNDAAEFKAVGP
jgi:hypothetical protein